MQTQTIPRGQLHLAEHVRACCIDEQVILFDLRQGQYHGVAAKPLALLDPPITGLSIGSPGGDSSASRQGRNALSDSLLARGLITHQSVLRENSPHVDEALQTLNASDHARHVVVTTSHVWHFLAGTASAALSLRCRSLLAIVNSVAARRARRTGAARGDSSHALHEAVAAFEKLRPLLFTSRDKCLFDSLALINFLALEGMFPRWVVGVNTRPFRAHSWVQHGSMVLNDLHEHVRPYHPILVV